MTVGGSNFLPVNPTCTQLSICGHSPAPEARAVPLNSNTRNQCHQPGKEAAQRCESDEGCFAV